MGKNLIGKTSPSILWMLLTQKGFLLLDTYGLKTTHILHWNWNFGQGFQIWQIENKVANKKPLRGKHCMFILTDIFGILNSGTGYEIYFSKLGFTVQTVIHITFPIGVSGTWLWLWCIFHATASLL